MLVGTQGRPDVVGFEGFWGWESVAAPSLNIGVETSVLEPAIPAVQLCSVPLALTFAGWLFRGFLPLGNKASSRKYTYPPPPCSPSGRYESRFPSCGLGALCFGLNSEPSGSSTSTLGSVKGTSIE